MEGFALNQTARARLQHQGWTASALLKGSFVLTMLCIALATNFGCVRSEEPPAAVPVPWPVHVVDCDSHPAGRTPLAVVGSLFTGGHCFREDDGNRVHVTPADQIVMPARCVGNKYSKAMTEYLLGNIRPRPSCNEEETCVFLSSPPRENGWDFTVDSVVLEGNVWTVTVSSWSDDIPHQWSPGPNRTAQMLRLGWLPPGDYVLRLVYNDRFMSAKTTRPGVYDLRTVKTAESKFVVAKGDPWHFHPWDQAPSTCVITQEQLKPLPDQTGPAAQPLYYATKRLAAAEAKDKKGEGAEVYVAPPLDWRKHSQQAATLWERAPGAGEGVLVARVTGGVAQVMGRYDWAEVEAVVWETPAQGAPNVTVHCRVWRRAFIDGRKAEPTVPAFAIPLAIEGLGKPGDLVEKIAVKVRWSEGTDNPRGAVYEVRH